MKEVHRPTHSGLFSINLTHNQAPFTEPLRLPEGYLEMYKLDKMRCVRHTVSAWAANWKTGVDAFYETYHLHAVHPETQDVMDDMGVQVDLYPHGCSRMLVPIAVKTQRPADQEAMNPTLEHMRPESRIHPAQRQASSRYSVSYNAMESTGTGRSSQNQSEEDQLVRAKLSGTVVKAVALSPSRTTSSR